MSQEKFSSLGKVEAIRSLYEGTPFKAFDSSWFKTTGDSYCTTKTVSLLEGMDFNLEYFPLKHLGYKSVIAATGELYAEMSHPRTLCVVLGISSKLDFTHVKDLWDGIVAAAVEHGYSKVDLDLVPSLTGLCINVSATGETSVKDAQMRPQAKSMDLVCVSDNLGAAYLGQQALEKRLNLEENRQLVGAYLKPELGADTLDSLKQSGICPSFGYFVRHGLADAVKRLGRDSGLGVKIYADRMPFAGNTFSVAKQLDIDAISAAMGGGDDYCLLFTVPLGMHEAFRHDFQTWDIIGHLAKADVGEVLVTPDGIEFPIKAQGWQNA